MTPHPYSIEDRRQPDEPTPAEEAFDIAMEDMTLEAFAELLERNDALRERVAELTHSLLIAGLDYPQHAEGHARHLATVVQNAVRAEIDGEIESDRLADAAEADAEQSA